MIKECYVIYSIHKDKETDRTEGVTILACVGTEAKARGFLETEADKYGDNAEWFNESCIRIVDDVFPLVHYVTYQTAYNDIEEELK